MTTSTISSKYQVVIPKELRKRLQVKPGQKVTLEASKNGDITIKTGSRLDEFYGILSDKKIWGDNPAAYISKQRDEWEERQKKVDAI